MGNIFRHVIFWVALALFVRKACEALPVSASSHTKHLPEPLDSDHDHDHHSHEQLDENSLTQSSDDNKSNQSIKLADDETETESVTEDVESSTTPPTESEKEAVTSGLRIKRQHYDAHGHSHCYGGEWRYKSAYWAHGHWHRERWVWQRPHCHYYHDHDRK